MKRTLIGISVAAVIVTGTIYASTWRDGFRHAFGARLMAHIAHELQLTDAQQTRIKSLIDDERKNAAPLLAQAANNRRELHEATAGGKFDEAQVRAIAARQAQTMSELIVVRERVKAKIYNEILTPEQRSKADQLIQRLDKRFTDGSGAGELEGRVPLVP